MRVLYIMATTSYRARAFMEAAREAGVDVAVASDHDQVLASQVPGAAVRVDFSDEDASLDAIRRHAARFPLDAVLATEDDGAVLAARAAAHLGLRHNAPEAVRDARYKDQTRAALHEAGVATPRGRTFDRETDPRAFADGVRYPCVLKPLSLSASRGVIRADDPRELRTAFLRIRDLLEGAEAADDEKSRRILIEDYVPGTEVAVEGLLLDGALHVLALFDKPDPLDGPYFEETIYVTPSRHPPELRRDVIAATRAAVAALGLRHGPIHAELRHDGRQAWIIEVAPRSIGGLCARVLRFEPEPDGPEMSGDEAAAGRPPPPYRSLERVILEEALGRLGTVPERESRAAGVMMIPIPAAGVLKSVEGVDAARAVEGVEEVVVSIPIGQQVVPLPEGNRYLGFIFARAPEPAQVEEALREAHRRMEVVVAAP